MVNVYIDSTLHSDWNFRFNPQLCKALEQNGLSVYLPQRDTNQINRDTVFKENKDAIDNSQVILAISQNESPNWGVEVGYGFANNKPVICLTDKDHQVPLMALHMCKEVIRVEKLENIEEYIQELIKVVKLHIK